MHFFLFSDLWSTVSICLTLQGCLLLPYPSPTAWPRPLIMKRRLPSRALAVQRPHCTKVYLQSYPFPVFLICPPMCGFMRNDGDDSPSYLSALDNNWSPMASLTREDIIGAEILALALVLFFISVLLLAVVFALLVHSIRSTKMPPQSMETGFHFRRFTV